MTVMYASHELISILPNPTQYFANQTVHPRKRKPLFAEVFDGSTDVVEFFFVDDEEAVVDVLDAVNFDGRILRIAFFQIESQGSVNALRVYCCRHAFVALGELQQHRMVDVVVDENDGVRWLLNQLAEEYVGIEDLVLEEDAVFL